ncbi:CRISPR-associated endonuclease Cas1 [Salinivibrio sharmensis]|uniref:CRISPR-associated endonuclease Cas1 n=1 Tax=Salinivibrio sharmensis TaxID=390883 RepID=A0ABX3KES8_9GAMM|nr:CRISPR-associated endonuclease Cas1 [Salinivibrio sharmensis]OOE87295.1 CRISPR-associated endonuclease Cas1 [Salinivibrio sharmensis]
MQHIVIHEYGKSLGITSERLVIKEGNFPTKEIPLRKISTLSIQKPGISLSSNLLSACARYGIKVFIGNRAQELCCLHGNAQHAVVQNRIHQFEFLSDDEQRYRIARAFIYGKVRNQRTTMLYFNKQKCGLAKKQAAAHLAAELHLLSQQVRDLPYTENWNATLMGLEGRAAASYWQVLSEHQWLGEQFTHRTGRGAQDPANQALNYGYGILSSVIWNALTNAGLEVYLGALHAIRPGKPALVLDVMEEYRAWVVDRAVIKLRSQLNGETLKPKTRKKLTNEILTTLAKPIPYRSRKIRLESVMQRQCYRLCGMFADEQKYRPLLFRW